MLYRPEGHAAWPYLDLEKQSEQDLVVGWSQHLIWNGLRYFLKHSNSPENRKPLSEAASHYDDAKIMAREMMEGLISSSDFKLLYGVVAIRKPLPLENKEIYVALARNNHEGVTIRQAIEPVTLASGLDPTIADRDFRGVNDTENISILRPRSRQWRFKGDVLLGAPSLSGRT